MPARCCWRRWPTRYARRHASDPRFTFGTGKLGDLAGFTSAIVLAMIALLIGYEAVSRLFAPVPIHFREAIPIACLGLAVNIASAWLLSGGAPSPWPRPRRHTTTGTTTARRDSRVVAGRRALSVEHFRGWRSAALPAAVGRRHRRRRDCHRLRRSGPTAARQPFAFRRSGRLSGKRRRDPRTARVPARLRHRRRRPPRSRFEEHDHCHGAHIATTTCAPPSIHVHGGRRGLGAGHRRAVAGANVRVALDGPDGGDGRRVVIASWSYGLVRDTGAHPAGHEPGPASDRDAAPDDRGGGDRLTDLHVWRLGPGHLGAELTVGTSRIDRAAGRITNGSVISGPVACHDRGARAVRQDNRRPVFALTVVLNDLAWGGARRPFEVETVRTGDPTDRLRRIY